MVGTAIAQELNSVFAIKQVREEVSKANTGTTFLLSEDGLYIVRRPALERERRRREQERFF